MDITIADGEPFIPGDYSVGDTIFGTLPGAPWVFATGGIVGAVRRNPARPAGTTVADRRAVRQQNATFQRQRARQSICEMQYEIEQQLDAMRLS